LHRVEIHPPKLLRRIVRKGNWTIRNSENKIYLTFDDGPIPVVTEWVLDILREYGVKATFFCVGENVKKHPEVYKRVLSEGHAVGGHTYNHLNAWRVKKQHYIDNIVKCEAYVKTNLFRPPHGKVRGRISRFLERRNYNIVLWDVVSRDYDRKLDPQECFENVKRYTREGSIIVFHDSLKAEKNLRYALPKAIEYLLGEGFVFDTIRFNN